MIGTRRKGGAEVGDGDGSAVADERPARAAKARQALPVTRLLLPTIVLGLGLAGEFILPTHLTYAASTALCYGLVGLSLYLPLAALRELPLNGAALAGLSAYLFAYHAASGGAGQGPPRDPRAGGGGHPGRGPPRRAPPAPHR